MTDKTDITGSKSDGMTTGEGTGEITETKNSSDPVSCPLCLESCQNPKLLPCGHPVCRNCLGDYVDETSDQRSFLCPTCHNSTTPPQNDLDRFPCGVSSVDKPDEVNENPKSLSCDPCAHEGTSSIAELKCVECRENMCCGCAKAHAKFAMSRNHHIIPVAEISQGDITRMECRDHPDEAASYFCVPCQTLICGNCERSDHSDHKVVTCQEAIREKRSDMKRQVLTLQNKLSEISTVMDQISENISRLEEGKKFVNNTIGQRREDLVIFITRISHKAIEHNDNRLSGLIQKQQTELDKTQLLQSRLQSHISYTDTLLSSDSDVELLYGDNSVKEKSASLNAESTSVPDYQMPSFQPTLDASVTDVLENHFTLRYRSTPPREIETRQSPGDENFEVTKMAVCTVLVPKEHLTIPSPGGMSVAGMALYEDRMYVCAQGKLFQFGGETRSQISDRYQTVSYQTEGRAYGVCADNNNVVVTKKSGGHPAQVQLVVRDALLTHQARLMLSFESSHPTIVFGRPADGHPTYFVTEQSRSPAVHHIDYTGNTLQTYGEDEVKSPRGLAVDGQGDLLVADPLLDDVVLFGRDGSVKLRLRQHNQLSTKQLSKPHGVCVDKNGYIFVASRATDSVLLFSAKGDYLSTILTRNDGMHSPSFVALSGHGHLAVDIEEIFSLNKIRIYSFRDFT